MLICAIQYVKGTSKKTGEPYEAYVLHGLVKRFNGDIQTDNVWISPDEYNRSKPVVGDLVRIFRDGGVLIQEHFDISEFIKMVC